MTDTTRYKSIIVRIETHAKLKELAGKDRKISGVVSQLVEKEYNKKRIKKKSKKPPSGFLINGQKSSRNFWTMPNKK